MLFPKSLSKNHGRFTEDDKSVKCLTLGKGAGEGIEVGSGEAMKKGEQASRLYSSSRKGFSKERVEAALKAGGKMSRAELLRCQVRWFSDGVAIGSKGFVEGIFNRCREHFGPKHKTGARPVRGQGRCRGTAFAARSPAESSHLRPWPAAQARRFPFPVSWTGG